MRMTVCCVGRNSNNVPIWRVWMDTCDGMFSAFEYGIVTIEYCDIAHRATKQNDDVLFAHCASLLAWMRMSMCYEVRTRYVLLMRWYESWATRRCILINSSTYIASCFYFFCHQFRWWANSYFNNVFCLFAILNILKMDAMPHHKAGSARELFSYRC